MIEKRQDTWIVENKKIIKKIHHYLDSMDITPLTLIISTLWFLKYNFEFSKRKDYSLLQVATEKNWENLILKNRNNANIAKKIDEHIKEINKKSKSFKLYDQFKNTFNKIGDTKKLQNVINELNSNQPSLLTDNENKEQYQEIFNFILQNYLKKNIAEKGIDNFENHLIIIQFSAFLIKKYLQFKNKEINQKIKIYNPNLKFGYFFVEIAKLKISNEFNFYAFIEKQTDLYLSSLNLLMHIVNYKESKEIINLFLTDLSQNAISILKQDQKKNLINTIDIGVTKIDDEVGKIRIDSDDIRWKNLPKTTDYEFYYIYDILSKLNKQGIAFIILKQSLTTNETSKPVREYLIKNDLIEAIFKLPDANSRFLLILNKEKNKETKNKILFFDSLGKQNFFQNKEAIWENYYLNFLNNNHANLKIFKTEDILNSIGIKLDYVQKPNIEKNIKKLSFEEKKTKYNAVITKLNLTIKDIKTSLNNFVTKIKK